MIPGFSPHNLLVFGAAALFVFLVLVAQYENRKLPLSIVLIVPMCLLASVTGLLARGMPIDILARIGFVVLVGLAAKNAILIVEFARVLRRSRRDVPPRLDNDRYKGIQWTGVDDVVRRAFR